MNSSNFSGSSYAFKSENSPNTAAKNIPLSGQEHSFPALIYFVNAKKKTTKGEIATLYEVLVVIWCPASNKFITAIWSIWSNQTLFLTMLEQMKRESSTDRPLLLYTENGSGKNSLYELTLFQSNKYSVFTKDGNEDIQHTAQVI